MIESGDGKLREGPVGSPSSRASAVSSAPPRESRAARMLSSCAWLGRSSCARASPGSPPNNPSTIIAPPMVARVRRLPISFAMRIPAS